MSIVERQPRRRRTAEAARAEALAAARALLLEQGPEAVTLKAVATAVGATHGNLIHHFGSAAGLQSALMASMVDELSDTIRGAAAGWLAEGGGAPGGLVDPVFAAFSEGGAAKLAARIALSRDPDALSPVRDAVLALTDQLSGLFPDTPHARPVIARAVLNTTLLAFADALIGPQLREMLNLKRDDPRNAARALLEVQSRSSGAP